ncbi:hypothetical protein D9758_011184 [Tetrapyrgos nigripes]|uniref:AB hydrolase-1 domain-containing protein n=1 Tax=Tetrapyrgos nigripes TaxID=182062 RepID=A0A8H5FZK2_9AGAR|nr:hypothetical protein D9758_011184 [Tetrapyrgos nigripes]
MSLFTSTCTTPDGAVLTYEIAGKHHLKDHPERKPFIFVCGMSNRRCDFDRLVPRLARTRPVMTYDHRGMGDSRLPKNNDKISIEIMARDLLHLISHLGWKQVVVCGFSMGGVIAQQVVLLPYHPTEPCPLPFKITHLVLAGTLCSPSVFLDENGQLNGKAGLKFPRLDAIGAKGRPLTHGEKRELVRPTMEATFDKSWLEDERNKERMEFLLNRMVVKRPMRIIAAQSKAMLKFRLLPFSSSPSSSGRSLLPPPPNGPQIVIIHGKRDAVTPWECAEELIREIPHARVVREGEIDHLEFGHTWHEYFDPEGWVGILEGFVGEENVTARL